jgi:hypothetical protein
MIITEQFTEKMALIRDLNKTANAINEVAGQNKVAAASDFDDDDSSSENYAIIKHTRTVGQCTDTEKF